MTRFTLNKTKIGCLLIGTIGAGFCYADDEVSNPVEAQQQKNVVVWQEFVKQHQNLNETVNPLDKKKPLSTTRSEANAAFLKNFQYRYTMTQEDKQSLEEKRSEQNKAFMNRYRTTHQNYQPVPPPKAGDEAGDYQGFMQKYQSKEVKQK